MKHILDILKFPTRNVTLNADVTPSFTLIRQEQVSEVAVEPDNFTERGCKADESVSAEAGCQRDIWHHHCDSLHPTCFVLAVHTTVGMVNVCVAHFLVVVDPEQLTHVAVLTSWME